MCWGSGIGEVARTKNEERIPNTTAQCPLHLAQTHVEPLHVLPPDQELPGVPEDLVVRGAVPRVLHLLLLLLRERTVARAAVLLGGLATALLLAALAASPLAVAPLLFVCSLFALVLEPQALECADELSFLLLPVVVGRGLLLRPNGSLFLRNGPGPRDLAIQLVDPADLAGCPRAGASSPRSSSSFPSAAKPAASDLRPSSRAGARNSAAAAAAAATAAAAAASAAPAATPPPHPGEKGSKGVGLWSRPG